MSVRGARVASQAAVAALLAVAAGLGGCGGKAAPRDLIAGRKLTIYASLPLLGASRIDSRAILDGATMALAQARSRVGHYRIVLRPLDDSTPARGEWDPGQTTLNARLAVADSTTVGYLGELNSGASAVSIPVLARAGIVQVSPASTAVGLTSGGPGASPGEPDKYYPTGIRTFVRIVPTDAVQAGAQVTLQRSAGCRSTYILDDGEVDGEDTATSFALAAQHAGLRVAGVQAFDPRATDYTSLAATVAATGADCVLISAITESNAVLLTEQLAAGLPHARLFGSAGLAQTTYADPGQGGLPARLDSRLLITSPELGPSALPLAGQRFLAQYAQRYGPPQPAAIYGYESISLLLDAIGRASDGGTRAVRRSRVRAALFATHRRQSVLGTYSVSASGDTTVGAYGVYRVRAGQLSFWKAIGA